MLKHRSPVIGLISVLAMLGAAFVALAMRPVAADSSGAWKDLTGKTYTAGDLSTAKANVFFFVSTECPLANIYSPRMAELAREYSPKGVRFFLVDSNEADSEAKLKSYAAERSLRFATIKDRGTTLADHLGARATPEAVILDSKGEVRYRGRIDDNKERTKVVRQDVREAIDDIIGGRAVRVARTQPAGCAIFREKVAGAARDTGSKLTFAEHVAPILNASCVSCHRTGEVAPFGLENYQQAKTWATQIKEYTARKLMPPWKAVAGHGDFHDARGLTDTQIATLARWADTGAAPGDLNRAPSPPKFPSADAWSLGTPDLVVQPVGDYHLGPEGPDVYRNFVIPAEFDEDRYVRAIEFKPGNRAIVHHVVAYIDPKRASLELDGKDSEPGYTVPGVGIGILNSMWGEVWVPGRTPRFMPAGVGVRIPKGSKLVMQVHYHRNGAPQTDRTKMALFFSKEKPERIVTVFPVSNYNFELQPGNSRQVVKASMTVPADIHVRTMFPHMHLLGREMKVTATLPDGTKKPLIFVNDWDFNWQETYEYKQAVALPAGSRIDMEAVYDNSERNPHQVLSPPRKIRFGEQTTDEMCMAIMGFTFDNPALEGFGRLRQN
jgi:hypothetical protein